ncbi:hypothetical protein GPECTOR_38g271 [Gonium pectorale]|uniref:Uncharacterized protein n=1 Tax=Gonium pectorale TaxID=33097 RepID=A0A150GB37_GONPE|nr:hypothetical protein GPECTOR_38g271 [Gonium pectorale]|eukprot:KXZ47034.1 hypothetical protein GPECTOR_38g271 [Gonium pectorale]
MATVSSGTDIEARPCPLRVGQLPLDMLADQLLPLGPNDVPLGLRCISKAAVSLLPAPKYTTIRLSQRVPPRVFAAHWLAPGATRKLTLKQRRQLMNLTAASGVVPNLEVAVQAAGCSPTHETFMAAAAGGHLDSCEWLFDHGCPVMDDDCEVDALSAAAKAGNEHMCEWLSTLEEGDYNGAAATEAALRGGHPGLADWLLQRYPRNLKSALTGLLSAAAGGCDLATLQRYVQQWGWGRPKGVEPKQRALAAAAGSPTPDWVAKVEWLEAQGCPPSVFAGREAAERSDAVGRLAWLRGRGYPLRKAEAAMLDGDPKAPQAGLEALEPVLASLRRAHNGLNLATVFQCADAAAERGDLDALQALHDAGYRPTWGPTGRAALRGGRVEVLEWLAAVLGEPTAQQLDVKLLVEAAGAGCVEGLAWLRARSCPWDVAVMRAAANAGSEEALEWLVERGCPMPVDGGPYTAAGENRDLATLRCLRRLHVPWGPPGMVFLEVLGEAYDPAMDVLRWLLEAGCPVDAATLQHVHYASHEWPWEEVVELLQEQRRRDGVEDEDEDEEIDYGYSQEYRRTDYY